MAKVRVRPESKRLYLDFHYKGVRCREYTALEDSIRNRRQVQSLMDKIQAEIAVGVFDYSIYFPQSKNRFQFESPASTLVATVGQANSDVSDEDKFPLFNEFVEVWLIENNARWRLATQELMRHTIDKHLLPTLGPHKVNKISKADVLLFRANLTKHRMKNGRPLTPKTINHIVGAVKSILVEAADRYGFPNPLEKLSRLKVPKTHIEPFSLVHVLRMLETVREDYRPYLTVRFFTGMRTGEADGLKWKYIDWERKQILVRETWSRGRTEYTKNDGSQREIDISPVVWDALVKQKQMTAGMSEYVFCGKGGCPLTSKNFVNRVWNPLLRFLDLTVRRPYQMRHTAATLWLASGENPEWIARQLGHTSTEMLFTVYSRFIPNLTRKDGTAFANLLANHMILAEVPE